VKGWKFKRFIVIALFKMHDGCILCNVIEKNMKKSK
jgi:hypothetical protein